MVLTGASSGIGEAAAYELAARGYALVLAAQRAERLGALARRLDPSGSRVVAVPTDVTQDAGRRALIAAARAHFGRTDVLINNAGIASGEGDWWDDPDPLRVLRVNLEAPVALSALVLPEWRARGSGHLVNVASVAGHVAVSGVYSASKFGLRGFSRSLRRELWGTGVEVSTVSPGFVRTEMTARSGLPMPGPGVVARALADVLERPRAEVIVPPAYRGLVALDALFPALVDGVLGRALALRRRGGRGKG